MRTVGRTVLKAACLALFGMVVLLAPLVATVYSLAAHRWVLAAICLGSFFGVRRLLFAVEDRVGIRSYQNPESRVHGSGVMFVAPWVKKKFEECEQKDTEAE